jgi:hypothetical protein
MCVYYVHAVCFEPMAQHDFGAVERIVEGRVIESTSFTFPAFVLQSATEVVTISICKEHLFGIIGISLTPEEP